MASDDCLHYIHSPYFTELIKNYLTQNEDISPLYHRFSTLESFEQQLIEKKDAFSQNQRNTLVDALKKQYAKLPLHENVEKHLQKLADENTFTVTTGHQLNLFTGPLYFIYKIASTIKTCQLLSERHPNHHFVPVYWMATEDHDFDEIRFFNYKNQKIAWDAPSGGPVGRMPLNGLSEVMDTLKPMWQDVQNGRELLELFEKAYLQHQTLSEATRYLANALFESYGLIIVDGDDVDLKKSFAPFVLKELKVQTTFHAVNSTLSTLPKNQVQVNPREINLFYVQDDLRERIVYESGFWKVLNTTIQKTEDELDAWVHEAPECFSPNVLLRPLYQEVVLPNLSYIGGGGEIAYWMELKKTFEAFEVPFPILQLRNSVAVIPPKWKRKVEKLGCQVEDMFRDKEELIKRQIQKNSSVSIPFEDLKAALHTQFEQLKTEAIKTDSSFSKAINAQERKQIKGLEQLEKRLWKAERKKHYERLEQLQTLHEQQFPKGILQERVLNFSEVYLTEGASFIPKLIESLDPFDFKIQLYFTEHDGV